jgi:thiol:disulfide interchange protein
MRTTGVVADIRAIFLTCVGRAFYRWNARVVRGLWRIGWAGTIRVVTGLWVGGLCLEAAPHTSARLVFAEEVVVPGGTVRAGVVLRMDAGWHTYWLNPGDSGGATEIRWTLPPGVVAGSIEWPVPERYEVAGLVSFVFHEEVLLAVPFEVAADHPGGRVEVNAEVSWLECADVCLMGSAKVSGTFEVGPVARSSSSAPLFEHWAMRRARGEEPPGLRVEWEPETSDETRGLVVEWTGARGRRLAPDFFSYPGAGYVANGRPEVVAARDPGATAVRLKVRRTGTDWPLEVPGVLVESDGQELLAYAVALRPAEEVGHVRAPAGSTAKRSLGLMLIFAFIGGLILNAMPCVLPVISLKILSLVSQSGEHPGRVRWLGMVYGLGVLVSFLVLAGVTIGVKQAGGLANWGLVLQNQTFRVVITVVVALVAFNLFGLFEVILGGRLMAGAGDLAGREGAGGAFLNGVLATVLATPCTAPFLTVALAFAFTQPALVILVFFLVTGLGLASPFIILCWRPGWMRWLPRPGLWMHRFKVAMGFPMLATAVWLFWFTAPRYGKLGILWLGLFLVLLAAGVWTWGEFVQKGAKRRGLAMGVSLGLVVFGYFYILEHQLDWRSGVQVGVGDGELKRGRDGIDWQVWSPEAVAAARAEGHLVLVDFTADNCLNCQVNKVTSLEISSTRTRLRDLGAVAFTGDFTDQDARIASELQRYERAGVPLVLVYPADPAAEPIVLPPILTPGIVLRALDQAAGKTP